MLLGTSIILGIVLITMDQALKFWVTVHVTYATAIPLFPGVLSLTNVQNRGAAWSILAGQQWFFIVVAIVALLILGDYLWRCRFDWRYELIITLLIAGTLGNLVNRITSRTVIDMLRCDLINFPIFNLADCYLTVGVIGLIILIGTNQKVRELKNEG